MTQAPVYQNQLEEIACVQCSAPLRIRGMGRSAVFGCQYCGSVNGLSGKHLEILSKGEELRELLILPLGSRANFENTQFEVIGCITRSDPTGQYRWDEYLLLNPYRGYRWLVEQNGHWLYVEGDPKLSGFVGPTIGYTDVSYDGVKYSRFDSGYAKVVRVVGECYWEVKADDTTRTIDYISPPFMLSFEQSGDELVGSKCVYLEADDLKEAFKDTKLKLPWTNGVAPAQPNPHKTNSRLIGLTFIVIFFILTFFHSVFLKQSYSKLVYSTNLNNAVSTVNGSAQEIEKISTPFEIESGPSNVRVDISAPVSNNWLSVIVSLVNSEGDLVDEKEVEVSYYYGRDSDGSWSEGSDRNSELFEKVPAGKYTISTTATTNMTQSPTYTLKVYNRVPYWGNYIFVLVMISVYPLWMWIKSSSFETRRKQNSDELSGTEE
jgi:hypothetical protein